MSLESEFPVHSSLEVLEGEEIYQSKEWWKAVVRYQYDTDDEYDETAIYLWHKDGEWKRKNKYVIKTIDAWTTDSAIVNGLFSGEIDSRPDSAVPVSDYYEIGAGETVFRSSDWWKAIVKIVQKGSHETEEIAVYLWQNTDDGWRRRQKYTIKNEESWGDETAVVESVLGHESESEGSAQEQPREGDSTEVSIGEFEQLNREIEKHLSQQSLE